MTHNNGTVTVTKYNQIHEKMYRNYAVHQTMITLKLPQPLNLCCTVI